MYKAILLLLVKALDALGFSLRIKEWMYFLVLKLYIWR